MKTNKNQLKGLVQLVIISAIVAVFATIVMGCGKAKSTDDLPGGTSSTGAVPTDAQSGCPSGYWPGIDAVSHISVGTGGLVTINNNGCVTSGYVTCTGGAGNFYMNLDTKSKQAMDVNECQDVGVWKCSYQINSATVAIYCPETKTGNWFSPAKEYYLHY